MRKKISLLTLAIALTVPCGAIASVDTKKSQTCDFFTDTYLSIGAGVSMPSNKIKHLVPISEYDEYDYRSTRLKKSEAYRISLGKSFDNFRSEVEFLYGRKYKSKYDTDIQYDKSIFNVSSYSYFLNGFYDFKNFNDTVVPYVGAGIGLSRNHLSNEKLTLSVDNVDEPIMTIIGKKKTSFAWNIGLGVMFNINKHLAFDLSYKYTDLGKLKGSKDELHADTGDISEGEKYNVKGKLRNNVLLASFVVKF